jgi:arsenite methyltransferase
MARLARQLAHPSGVPGRFVGRMLNRGNAGTIAAAVDVCGAGPGDATADVGFGGAVGLQRLLELTGPGGVVHGVELSTTLLSAARRRFRQPLEDGRLCLHEGSLERLPMEDGSLTAVLTVNTFYFLSELAPVCAELARVLIRGGRVVVGVGDPDAMARLPVTTHGFRLRPVAEIWGALMDAGLHMVQDHRVGDGPDAYHLLVAARPQLTA